jgi:hypothetical protein
MTAGTLVEELHLSGAALWPETDAGLDLGTSALGFNDLHLGSGGVINLDGGDVTLTHSSGTLTYGGDGAVSVAFGANVDLAFTGGTGTNEIVLTNGLADALSITDGSADVIAISTAGGTNTVAITGDLTVSGTIAADTATVATTVTITDNEATNEANAIIFTAGGDLDGGNLGLESDGTLNYNPSTGTLTTTTFAGALTGNVTGNASGTAATVTGGTQASITSTANLVTVGTIGTGVWAATDVAVAHGGTGASSATAGFDALSPMTAEGDILYGGSSGTVTKLAKGSDDDVLTLASGVPSWASASAGDITGVTAGTGLSGGGSSGSVTLNVEASQSQITTVGALNAGSITSGFTSIDVGAGAISTTGTLTAGALAGAWNVASIWRLNTDLVIDNGGPTFITANLEESDETDAGILGASMTQSSGIFTFPSAGIWKITLVVMADASTGVGKVTCQIVAPAASGITASIGNLELPTADDLGSMVTMYIFDVEDTGNETVKFRVNNQGSDDMTIHGSTSNNETYMVFERLGDT